MTDRVVVTGRGLITPIGIGLKENLESLKAGRTGTVLMPYWKEMNLDSQVAGKSNTEPERQFWKLDTLRKPFPETAWR